MNSPNNKNQNDPGDIPVNLPHAIERLLGKPLLPLTEQRPYQVSEEVWPDLEALELLAEKRSEPHTTKSHFGKEERQYLYKINPAMQNPVQASTVRM